MKWLATAEVPLVLDLRALGEEVIIVPWVPAECEEPGDYPLDRLLAEVRPGALLAVGLERRPGLPKGAAMLWRREERPGRPRLLVGRSMGDPAGLTSLLRGTLARCALPLQALDVYVTEDQASADLLPRAAGVHPIGPHDCAAALQAFAERWVSRARAGTDA